LQAKFQEPGLYGLKMLVRSNDQYQAEIDKILNTFLSTTTPLFGNPATGKPYVVTGFDL
jgi:hypothetical protein